MKMARLSVNISDKIADVAPHKPPKVSITTVSPQITCHLCKGYLIDATTIVECLHSFCHSCIMKHLRLEQYCPICEMMINKAKPNIKRDATLQAIVYKLVPGLYEKELHRRRAFYKERPAEAKTATPEQRGDDTEHLIFSPTEKISLSLEYSDNENMDECDVMDELKHPKYLQCPAVFTVSHLKKFVLYKFGIDANQFCVEIMYKVRTIVLPDHYTLMDVAYIYTWKRDAPMRFFYRVRTNETSFEELPEVPLRRSPSIADRTALTTATETPTDITGASTPTTTASIPSESAIVIKFIKPEPPSTINTVINTKSEINVAAEIEKPITVALAVENSPVPTITTTDTTSTTTTISTVITNITRIVTPPPRDDTKKPSSSPTNKLPKVKTPRSISVSDDKQVKPKIAKKVKEENAMVVAVPEKRVENIKLKIDQNSVTIIKSSTKELKMKFKKERELKESNRVTQNATCLPKKCSDPTVTSGGDRKKGEKRDVASIKLAKVTETTANKNGEIKYEIKSPIEPRPPSIELRQNVPNAAVTPNIVPLRIKKEVLDIDEQQSEFLNSFELTPTKSLSPEKLQKIKLNQMSPPRAPVDSNARLADAKVTKIEGDKKPTKSEVKAVKPMTSPKRETEKKPLAKPLLSLTAMADKKSIISKPIDAAKVEVQLVAPLKVSSKNESKSIVSAKSINDITSLLSARTTSEAKSIATDVKPSAASKRKNKEPIKNVAKKCRSNSPVLIRHSPILETLQKSKTPPLDKRMYDLAAMEAVAKKADTLSMPPPSKRVEVSDPKDLSTVARPKPVAIQPKCTTSSPPLPPSSNSDQQKMSNGKEMQDMLDAYQSRLLNDAKGDKSNISVTVKPIDKLMPKPLVVNNVKRPSQSDTPRPSTAAKQSRSNPATNTPKKLPNILPKPTTDMPPPATPPPLPPLPTPQSTPIVNMLRNPDTEIKQIKNDGTNKDIKVYGPAMEKPKPIKPAGSASPAYVPSFPSAPVKQPHLGGVPGGYLNYALMNSHKRATAEPSLSMRSSSTYQQQNSPSYSPNSPQFSPSYNIPPYPQYKYMKSPAHIANYFQGPSMPKPTKPDNKRKAQPDQQQPTFKRPNPKKPEPLAATPVQPENQKNVQSLLDSCNISFPSSLSITLHEQNDPASTNPLFNPKRNSPVNNYIEIVKLPDMPAIVEDTKKQIQHHHHHQSSPKEANPKHAATPKNDVVKRQHSPKVTDKPKSNNVDKKDSSAEMTALEKAEKLRHDQQTFQEKFLQSIRKRDEAAKKAASGKSQPKAILPKPVVLNDVANANTAAATTTTTTTSTTKTATPALHFRRQSTSSIKPKSSPTPDIASASSLRSHFNPSDMVKKSTSSPAISKTQHKGDGALDLTAPPVLEALAAMSAAASRMSPNNNNDHLKPSMEQQADVSALLAAYMARASHNPAGFMIPGLTAPHPMAYNQLHQQHMQQTYFLEHLARMQKAGHDQLNDAMEHFKHNLQASNAANNAASKNGDAS